MAWVTPALSREEINRAAKDYAALFDEGAGAKPVEEWEADVWDQYYSCVRIIDHWRACHAYPLNAFQINLRRMARKFDHASPLVAQRTKRLVSIGFKLMRNSNMKLTQMQDIGGCRAVLGSVRAVRQLDQFIRKESRMHHEFGTCDDYITHPKDSGYRGIHLVYRFRSATPP